MISSVHDFFVASRFEQTLFKPSLFVSLGHLSLGSMIDGGFEIPTPFSLFFLLFCQGFWEGLFVPWEEWEGKKEKKGEKRKANPLSSCL